jgi:hypothetical protein
MYIQEAWSCVSLEGAESREPPTRPLSTYWELNRFCRIQFRFSIRCHLISLLNNANLARLDYFNDVIVGEFAGCAHGAKVYQVIRHLVAEMKARQNAFWAWRECEWTSLYYRCKEAKTAANTLQHVMAMAALLCMVDLPELRFIRN